MAKTIKEIAEEIGVSKQAVFKKINQVPLSTEIEKFISTVNGKKLVSVDGEILIKQAFQRKQKRKQKTVDVNVDAKDDGKKFTVGDMVDGIPSKSQEQENTLAAAFQTAIDALTRQLEEKDRQLAEKDKLLEWQTKTIEELATSLAVAQHTAQAAQALHAGTINAYLAELDRYLQTYAVGTSTTDWRNVTEIATPSVLLSLPAGAVQAGLSGTDRAAQLENSILAWEEIMSICYTVQGITIQPEARQNIRCMQMFAGAFMYAAGNHVGIGFNSCAGMTGGAPLSQLAPGASANQLFGWGIAHEIGHNMDKLGKAEITNNIYSLAVQTSDGGQNTLPSRLEKSSKYEAIFNKTAQGRPGASGDVFVQLGMYWQLHLAYDDGAKPLDFYSRFFTAWKAQKCK